VQRALAEERAHTTVATLLTRLEERRLVAHRTEGRQYVYRASATEEAVRSWRPPSSRRPRLRCTTATSRRW
jgi:predicted transcriptional regulator